MRPAPSTSDHSAGRSTALRAPSRAHSRPSTLPGWHPSVDLLPRAQRAARAARRARSAPRAQRAARVARFPARVARRVRSTLCRASCARSAQHVCATRIDMRAMFAARGPCTQCVKLLSLVCACDGQRLLLYVLTLANAYALYVTHLDRMSGMLVGRFGRWRAAHKSHENRCKSVLTLQKFPACGGRHLKAGEAKSSQRSTAAARR